MSIEEPIDEQIGFGALVVPALRDAVKAVRLFGIHEKASFLVRKAKEFSLTYM
ncbi:MAG TPA: hypothetical protein VNO55_10135 [Polyangia bacterium]|nr:hypothetical protein [Polyangia bacterium]